MDQDIRTKKLIGDVTFKKIKNSTIMIIGLGGVGGSCTEMLARSGIGKIILVDYDIFEISNLNRQILSSYDKIGKYKVDVAKNRINSINKDCKINCYIKKVDDIFFDTLDIIPDYIIDACDDINAKISIVKYALKNKIKIISCCGTGNRVDPSKLCITNIWSTSYDPLAKKFRSNLRKNNIKYKLPVVSSTEKPLAKTTGFVGSMPCVPNSAGIMLASYVINDIISK